MIVEKLIDLKNKKPRRGLMIKKLILCKSKYVSLTLINQKTC
jgi:hypothetical protein